MAVTFSTKIKNQMLDNVLNGGTGTNMDSGKLRAWTGSAPAVDAAPTGTLIFDITLPADAFAAASSGSAAKSGTWQDTSANASGTPTYFRITESGDDDGATGSTYKRIQGTVGQGSGDLSLDNTTIVSTQQITISTLTVSI
jgi:hypothetical protein